ncbi:MAG: glutamate--tRNA ligase [Candidatus Micrarchaeota archaeon]
MPDLDSIIRKHVLKNAFDYGRANAGAVVGKVIAEFPDCKKDMKATMAKISAEIARVSKLQKGDIEKEMSGFEYAEKKEGKKELAIEGAVEGRVVTRFPPEPNGYPHIGHAKAFCLSWTIARRYNGRAILRWDDTNPEAEKEEYTAAIRDGMTWLGLDWDDEKYCSDYLPQMYSLCEKLLKDGEGCVCTCAQEEISKGREEMRRCACGSKKPADNLAGWADMLSGKTPEGGATVRLRGDMASQNTVMRDPTLFRILTAPHYRQGKKYRVWPTYDFQGAVMDSLLGITHPIRSKEYELRDELYVFLLQKLGLTVPKMISISRLSIKNAPISKRLLRPLVESGKLWGWDDPRMPTLKGLARRGILPEAIREFVLSFGISKVESEPDWEALLAENRKLLDPVSPHYFFVPEPVALEVKGLEKKTIELKLHPKKDMGIRSLPVSGNVFIPGADARNLAEGEIFRLKDLCNVKLLKKGERLLGELAPDSTVEKKLQWVSDGRIECTVVTPGDLLDSKGEINPESLHESKGFCEPSCAPLAAGGIVQFERFGFCRLDKLEPLTFIHSC